MHQITRKDIGKKCELHAEATVDNPKLACEALILDVDGSMLSAAASKTGQEEEIVSLVSFFVLELVDKARVDRKVHALIYLHPSKFKATLFTGNEDRDE